MLSIGQEPRMTEVAEFVRIRGNDWEGLTTGARDFVDAPADILYEEDGSFLVPASTSLIAAISSQGNCWSALGVNGFQLAAGEKPDHPAVSRPERMTRSFGSG